MSRQHQDYTEEQKDAEQQIEQDMEDALGEDTATFLASFPLIQSAIIVSGTRDGMQIKLSIPESEMGNAIRLQLWRGKMLQVTVKVHDEHNHKQNFQNQSDQDSQETSGEDSTADNARRKPARRSSAKQRDGRGDPGM